MNRPKTVVVTALAVYFVALGAAWRVVSGHAYRETENLLEQSEGVFIESVGDYLDSILLHAATLIIRDLGDAGTPVPQARLKELAERYQVDEINLCGTNGVCHSSTKPNVIGYDFRKTPETEEFLTLLHGAAFVAQPFRHGATDAQDYRKYLGLPIADGSGFIQLGADFRRACRVMLFFNRATMQAWKIGRTGFYDFYDCDGNGLCDYDLASNVLGEVTTAKADGRRLYVRPFEYAGVRFLSLLPEDEYFGERNLNFAIMAPTLAGLIALFAWLVLSMSRSAERERRLHAVEDANRARDLAIAKTIQLSALSSVAVFRRDCFSCSFAAETLPAKEVGGDFYDFYSLDENRLAIVMADVSGKGVPAAMFMMKAKNEIMNALRAESALDLAVGNANERLCANNDAEMFVTVWIGVVDLRTGEVTYVNAGHDRPFVRHPDGVVEKVTGKGGRFLGMFPDAKYRMDRFTLQIGDAFFLFTDGVTEAMDSARKLYGEPRLMRTLADGGAESPEAMIESVKASVRDFRGAAEQSDDFTALALLWHGEGNREERSFAADRSSLGEAMAFVSGRIAFTDRMEKSRLMTATDEIMSNIVNYSGSKDFTVRIENASGRVRLTFIDSGREYNPLQHADPDIHLTLEDRPEGGLGIFMVKHLVDSVSYRRENDCNMLTLYKRQRI